MAKVGATVEGYYAAEAAIALANRVGADLPIANELYRVMYQGKSPVDATADLMARQRKGE
jgi:glycerol-3-phosphate dehydrogenase (NAD(P)+)